MGRPANRPTATESRRRTVEFLTLIATGTSAEQAARQAGVGPWRALRIVTEADFLDIVQAIREGLTGVVAVELEADEAQAA